MSGVLTDHKKGVIILPTRDLGGGPLVPGEIAFNGVQFILQQAGGPAGIPPGVLKQYVLLDTVADAVTGQADTYYISKGITDLGYNVVVDIDGKPIFRLLINGAEQYMGTTGDTNADFTIVRSQSTGPEGPAASGSLNAIKFHAPIPLGGVWKIWYMYQQKDQAIP